MIITVPMVTLLSREIVPKPLIEALILHLF
jgi:hypothetical protein